MSRPSNWVSWAQIGNKEALERLTNAPNVWEPVIVPSLAKVSGIIVLIKQALFDLSSCLRDRMVAVKDSFRAFMMALWFTRYDEWAKTLFKRKKAKRSQVDASLKEIIGEVTDEESILTTLGSRGVSEQGIGEVVSLENIWSCGVPYLPWQGGRTISDSSVAPPKIREFLASLAKGGLPHIGILMVNSPDIGGIQPASNVPPARSRRARIGWRGCLLAGTVDARRAVGSFG